MPNTLIRHGARVVPSSGTTYSLNKNTLRGLSPQDIYEIKSAKEKLDFVFSKKKSYHYQQIKKRLDNDLNEILRGGRIPKIPGLMMEVLIVSQTQSLRNEVLKMIKKGKPLAGIPEYRGKTVDGDPIVFFREHYKRYIRRESEVIFSVDLMNIDKKLLTAMRNSASAEEMPIGSTVARTDAILKGRFKDDDESWSAAALAEAARRRRNAAISAHAKNA